LRSFGTIFSVFFVGILATALSPSYDIVILNGRVMDPESGLDAVRHIGINQGRIVALSPTPLAGKLRIDATGLIVAPGFIDLHQHGHSPAAYRSKALDGVTTALELEEGVPDADRWYAEREGKALINFGASASHIRLRAAALGIADLHDAARKNLDGPQLDALKKALEQQFERGAVGVGMGLEYTPGATPWEVLEVFRTAAKFPGAVVHVHVRGTKRDQYWLETEELIAASLLSGAPAQIVHANSSYGEDVTTLFEILSAAKARGVDITTECYPYTAGMTEIDSVLFDDWESWPDSRFARFQWPATGERLTRATFAKYRKAGGLVVMDNNTEEALRAAIASPLTMIASDGLQETSGTHPRSAGTFSRVLGRYVREAQLLAPMEALRKMTLMPAQRLEARVPAMKEKGRLRLGADADIVVFDLNKVLDRATYADPTLPSAGIEFVLVNGSVVVERGKIKEGVLPGAAIRGPHAPAQ